MCENCDIDTLIIANVSSEDVHPLLEALNKRRFYFTRMAGGAGFFEHSTTTLLIGIQRERYDELMDLLLEHCRKQRVHIPVQAQLEAHFQITHPVFIEAEIGGATILALPIEHFEQF